MSALILHGITRAGTPTPEGTAPHSRVDVDGIMGLVSYSKMDPTELSDTPDLVMNAALEHHLLLSHYTPYASVIPVRLGTAFKALPQLKLALERASDKLSKELRRLSDHSEYTLAVRAKAIPAVPHSDTKTGRDFLAARSDAVMMRRTNSKLRKEFLATIAGLLSDVVREVQEIEVRSPVASSSFAILVSAKQISKLVELCGALAKKAEPIGLGFTLTGPGPLYSFSSTNTEAFGGADAKSTSP